MMKEATARKMKQARALTMAASKRFRVYKDEEKRVLRAPDVIEDKKLKELIKVWSHYTTNVLKSYMVLDEVYSLCLQGVECLQYSANDVEKFSIGLANYQGKEKFEDYAGYFLSALINNCIEGDFIVHTRHLDRINYLGSYNTKNIIVYGDAGLTLGYRMKSGKITLNGSVGTWAGNYLENGEIVINGNGGDALGREMKSGKITVRGNAGDTTGLFMVNGEITIAGDCGTETGHGMTGGRIIINGNAGPKVGSSMQKGRIVINGDCGVSLGLKMNGGRIIVNGNAGKRIGQWMFGGTIRIKGDCKSFDRCIYGGRIYDKGKLIVDK